MGKKSGFVELALTANSSADSKARWNIKLSLHSCSPIITVPWCNFYHGSSHLQGSFHTAPSMPGMKRGRAPARDNCRPAHWAVASPVGAPGKASGCQMAGPPARHGARAENFIEKKKRLDLPSPQRESSSDSVIPPHPLPHAQISRLSLQRPTVRPSSLSRPSPRHDVLARPASHLSRPHEPTHWHW